MRCLLRVVVVLAGERLADKRCQEDRGEEEREPVLPREPPHCWVSPTVTKKTMPPTISTEYRRNIVRTMRVEFLSKRVCPAQGDARST